MRSARMILAATAATAALAFAATGAFASGDDDSDDGHDKSSYSKEEGDGSRHHEPRGGMHTGGGALAAVTSRYDWIDDSSDSSGSNDSGGDSDNSKYDPETYKDKSDDGEDSGSDKGGSNGDEDEDSPRGGMHTGGGALASPGVTTGGLAVLAVGATGVYALRRRNSAESAS
ncbi:hypothetical protein [Streptomyces sp. NPDC046805]|uniref:hypothetical protein n=1 Tax=Streptomyces sp. NPDC046805 TaxID=3155134 RepID=UPI0033F4577A